MTEKTAATYCYAHPGRETGLRCNRCERYICPSCAVRVPTGYTCKDCVREHQKKFDTAVWYDYLLVFVVSAILSGIASLLTSIITSLIWGFFILFLGPLAGITIANLVRRLVKNHRSKTLNFTLVAGMIAGTLPMLFVSGLGSFIMILYSGADFMTSLMTLGPLLWQGAYLVTAVPSAYSQFSGLFFRR